MSQEQPKKTRGRPSGSNSFVKMRLCDLSNLLGSNAVIPVSKVWLRENGISTGETLTPVVLPAAPAPVVEQPKIEFSLTTFDDEENEKDS
jgi:hypothetical protein